MKTKETPRKNSYDGSMYLEKLYKIELSVKLINRAVKFLKSKEFDAIAFRGMSGALAAIPISHKLKKPIIAVRKEDNTARHSSHDVEGCKNARNYVIVDDFIATGRTVYEIVKAVKLFSPDAECIGVLQITGNKLELTSIDYYWNYFNGKENQKNTLNRGK